MRVWDEKYLGLILSLFVIEISFPSPRENLPYFSLLSCQGWLLPVLSMEKKSKIIILNSYFWIILGNQSVYITIFPTATALPSRDIHFRVTATLNTQVWFQYVSKAPWAFVSLTQFTFSPPLSSLWSPETCWYLWMFFANIRMHIAFPICNAACLTAPARTIHKIIIIASYVSALFYYSIE